MTEITQEKYSLKPHHGALYVSLSGTWNREDTQAFCEDYKRLASRYFAREWANVTHIKDLDMLIDDDYQVEAFKALFSWSYIKGMGAVAVITSSANRPHLLYQFEEMFDRRQHFNAGAFSSEKEAEHWLGHQGFDIRLEEPIAQQA